jgi:hydroxymethylbilane synthase
MPLVAAMTPLRIGTRGSALALWQADHVARLLEPSLSPESVQVVEIETSGDQFPEAPLARIGGDGLFTKEIQRALLAGAVDVAVHSLKDLPTIGVPGLVLAAVPPRGPAGDVLVSRTQTSFDSLPAGAVVATGSLRRRAQVLHRRPDLRPVDIRGNVDSRLRKLQGKGLDALILAQAGVERLGMAGMITEVLSLDWMLPAVGQGALGLECRDGDGETRRLLQRLDHPPSRFAVEAERALLATLGGGCRVPVGVASHVHSGRLDLRAAVVAVDGGRRVAGGIDGPVDQATQLGKRLALELLAQGAAELLAGDRIALGRTW